MTITVFLTVMGAALLHASWNALVKGSSDKKLSMGAVIIGHLPLAILALFFVPSPAPESYPYLLWGIILHAGYQLFLLKSYETGDLTQVYPLARGSAPLMVTIVSLFFLGLSLSTIEILAIITIGIGIISLALAKKTGGQRNQNAAILALVTGMFIASYSIVDGLGARLSGSSIGFYCWLGIANAIVMAVYLAIASPKTLYDLATKGRQLFLVGGSASFIAYSLVTWAFTKAPIALVTALRETSILFAMIIGIVFLKERLDIQKIFSATAILLGVMLLRLF